MKRNIYIQKQYQSKMVAQLCLLTALGSAVFAAAMYLSLDERVGGTYAHALYGIRSLRWTFMQGFIASELLVMGFLGTGVIVLTLFMSHRIAGPLWRLEQTAKAVGGGDLTMTVRLREKDEVKFLADQMGRMVDDLRFKVNDIKAALRVVEDDVSIFRESLEGGGMSSLERKLAADEIREESRELLGKLDKIKAF